MTTELEAKIRPVGPERQDPTEQQATTDAISLNSESIGTVLREEYLLRENLSREKRFPEKDLPNRLLEGSLNAGDVYNQHFEGLLLTLSAADSSMLESLDKLEVTRDPEAEKKIEAILEKWQNA